jgi:hypothetical protein
VPDFHDQPAARLQVRGGLSQDAAHQVQSVAAAVQCQLRFVAEFRRQSAHHRCTHVGRIGKNQVIAFSGQGVEQIGADQSYPLCQAVGTDVAARNSQCSG